MISPACTAGRLKAFLSDVGFAAILSEEGEYQEGGIKARSSESANAVTGKSKQKNI